MSGLLTQWKRDVEG